MSVYLEDKASKELRPAMDANLAGFWSRYGLAENCVLHAGPAASWFYTGLQFSLFNGVSIINTDEAGVKQAFEDLQAQIAARPAPALWWISPLSQPENIGALLTRYGLEAFGEVPAMVMNLADLEGEPGVPPGFSYRRVDGPKMQALWGRIAAIGNGCNDEVVQAMERMESTIDDPRYHAQLRYIGYLDGEPVASTAAVLEAGVAGVYAVATVPEARRKGIGRYMTILPLLEAKQRGYRVGILQASSAGYPIYQKLGFQDVFKYDLYLQT